MHLRKKVQFDSGSDLYLIRALVGQNGVKMVVMESYSRLLPHQEVKEESEVEVFFCVMLLKSLLYYIFKCL